MLAADIFLTLAGAYLGGGFVFALAFVTVGVSQIDPTARSTSVGFRLLILPGSVALWPLLAIRWASRKRERPEAS